MINTNKKVVFDFAKWCLLEFAKWCYNNDISFSGQPDHSPNKMYYEEVVEKYVEEKMHDNN